MPDSATVWPHPGARASVLTAANGMSGSDPYIWGGGNTGVGSDCSGLVQVAYKAAGIRFSRASRTVRQRAVCSALRAAPTGAPSSSAPVVPAQIGGTRRDGRLCGDQPRLGARISSLPTTRSMKAKRSSPIAKALGSKRLEKNRAKRSRRIPGLLTWRESHFGVFARSWMARLWSVALDAVDKT